MRAPLILALALALGNAGAPAAAFAQAPAGAATRPLTPADSARADSIVWLGRRVAYLGLFPEAIAVYTRGLALFPDEPHLLRHRGHRYITVRDFARAEADLARAAAVTAGRRDEVEPDGQPNARGIPRSTLQGNIWYHLGLVRWLRGDAAGTAEAFERCLGVATNDDSRVSCRYWLWQAYHRLGRADEARAVAAAAHRETDVMENGSYQRLLELFMGDLDAAAVLPQGVASATLDAATLGYGIGAWHRAEGRPAEARRWWRAVVALEAQRNAFGYLAAEAELGRLAP